MRDRKTIVFDVDDVFWPLNRHVARIAGMDYEKIVTYIAKENPLLDEAQRQRLHDAYQTPGLHADMDFYPDAKGFGDIARDPRTDPWIISNSIGQDVVDNKIRNLRRFLGPDYGLFNTIYHVITMDESGRKKFPEGIHILVDDSPLNAAASGAGHILMPKRPWNTSEYGIRALGPAVSRVTWYDDPADACRIILEILDRRDAP